MKNIKKNIKLLCFAGLLLAMSACDHKSEPKSSAKTSTKISEDKVSASKIKLIAVNEIFVGAGDTKVLVGSTEPGATDQTECFIPVEASANDRKISKGDQFEVSPDPSFNGAHKADIQKLKADVHKLAGGAITVPDSVTTVAELKTWLTDNISGGEVTLIDYNRETHFELISPSRNEVSKIVCQSTKQATSEEALAELKSLINADIILNVLETTK